MNVPRVLGRDHRYAAGVLLTDQTMHLGMMRYVRMRILTTQLHSHVFITYDLAPIGAGPAKLLAR